MDNTITTLEFCAGYGGIGLGLKNIFGERLRCLAYCELEGFAQANLISKMEKGLLDVAPLWNDLKTFPYGKFHGLVDILIAGYPCQPFSAAGKRAGKDDPRHLWPWIADGIRILRPRVCFFENVEGHISLGLSSVISDLEELGYKVSWGIFSASEVGAPHQRKRVFILANLKCEGLERWRSAMQPTSNRCWTSNNTRKSRDLLANSQHEHDGGLFREGQLQQQQEGGPCGQRAAATSHQVWPSRPGEAQHGWEPPRVVANSFRSRGKEPEHLNANLPSKPSGRDSKGLGNADHGRLASGIDAGSGTEADRGGQSDIEQAEPRQIEPALGRDADGPAGGLGYAELQEPDHAAGGSESGVPAINNRELANGINNGCYNADQRPNSNGEQGALGETTETEARRDRIHSSKHGETIGNGSLYISCDNRTDELRLLGNGVVPATAERAFRTLIKELI